HLRNCSPCSRLRWRKGSQKAVRGWGAFRTCSVADSGPTCVERAPDSAHSSLDPKPAVSEWLRLLPFLGVLALLGYLAVRPFFPKKKQQKDSLINLKIQKENPKVVNEINIEDLCLTKAAYCRCWRSKTFPACDGSHNKHNELTGDNVGPLILKKKEV
ncbi:CDGSH iron-sulfur domain-containing protein 2 isoform X1, partial [Cricetulus griseus]|uniref:CDGSH iron-sulfur domain-containing protein 2 isoform X1 n=1 Tax=Cricetulus griseus TaxID=10029 RepID=UPI0015C3ACAD